MHIDIDYQTSAFIGKHSCSHCEADFNLREGLMIGIIQKSGAKATFFLCKECLEKRTPYQSSEFDITKDRYPKLNLR